jgi:hypothetical protein
MLNKIVNGVEVQCTAEEETSIRAEWEHPTLPKPTDEQLV